MSAITARRSLRLTTVPKWSIYISPIRLRNTMSNRRMKMNKGTSSFSEDCSVCQMWFYESSMQIQQSSSSNITTPSCFFCEENQCLSKLNLFRGKCLHPKRQLFPKLSAIQLEKLVGKPTTVTSTIIPTVHVRHPLPHTRDVRKSNAPAQLKVFQALGFKSR